jgi:hypothetical protein
MQNPTVRSRNKCGAGRALGHFRSFALSLVCASTVLATVGLVATPSGPVGASSARTALVHASRAIASTAGTNDTPASTSTSAPLSTLQSAYATTTLAKNGLHETQFSTTPVNYQDAQGAWHAIDNSLAPTVGGGWHNTANSWTAELPSTLSSAVTLSKGTSQIGFTLVGANDASTNAGTVNGSTATYPGALSATSVAEQAEASGVKETLRVCAKIT